ncbi:MAG TPA: hypothetical protein DE312_12860 [Gallionella sp.]|jgi:hypothetical protein|nr:hypothetical protein [Gallionella sp.]OGS68462.1 MAG: hypothetical protein A2Z87_11465 [Gallionellales bacterium GWA2_54_124]OGT17562.1 MAG: hypothetical protein A2522_07135 [Gallionellales bacterium RIFOXYD12_FULL_53_10]HCI54186.1 hypothetical protein [Gallionella sp.]
MSDNSIDLDRKNRSWGISRGVPRSEVKPVEVGADIPVELTYRRPTRLGLLMTARAQRVQGKVDDASGTDEE